MTTIVVRAFGEGDKVVEGASIDEVSDLLDLQGATLWIDLTDPSEDDMTALAAELGLHRLAVEDALERHQRDKYVHYDDHLYLVCHAVELDVDGPELRADEIDTFIGDRWMVTVHDGGRELLDRACQRWTQGKEVARHGVGFLVYGLLDAVVDGTATCSRISTATTTSGRTGSSATNRSNRPSNGGGSRCGGR